MAMLNNHMVGAKLYTIITKKNRYKIVYNYMTNNFQWGNTVLVSAPFCPDFSGRSCGRLCAPDAGLTTSKPKGDTPGELDG